MGLLRLKVILLTVLALAGCGTDDPAKAQIQRPPETIGLYSSLPIAWNESADLGSLLSDEAPPHWALGALKQRGRVTALDTLAPMQLPADGVLVLAQPRPLTPQENVALDAWVQAGGRVLLLVDPMLTAHSIFPIGDARRPQDIAMLSPILARWGLALEFDEEQEAGPRLQHVGGYDMPVNMPGRFRLLADAASEPGHRAEMGKAGDAVANCKLEGEGLLADCQAGKGRIIALADAALLENPEDSSDYPERAVFLSYLLDRLPPRT